jgi:predicted nucleic acid-binding protein
VKQFVIDASLTLDWCFIDEQSPYRDTILTVLEHEENEATAIVPNLWPLEVLNALIIAESRNRITYDEAQEFLAVIHGLDIEVEPTASDLAFSNSFDAIYALARKHRLTAYDAAYLELAIRRSLPLASMDEALNKAAVASGVSLVQLPPDQSTQDPKTV